MPQVHLTEAGGLAAGSTGPVINLDGSFMKGPIRLSSSGGYTGNTRVQHEVAGAWRTRADMPDGDDITVDTPVKNVRVSGTHTGANAVVVATTPA